ncbi:unnamed protein product [Paramecium sonneborni]|uniref:EF-hand domain-containing protein n=1 Tax=Paramecium sonneborni TaxID=65129 RepID=A0A8S1LM29_9CILI|nr:unnamed protein product [Paramecium sonneborni]
MQILPPAEKVLHFQETKSWFNSRHSSKVKEKYRKTEKELFDDEIVTETFRLIDRDHSNTIEMDELYSMLKKNNYPVNLRLLKDFFEMTDRDGNKCIDLEEFKQVIKDEGTSQTFRTLMRKMREIGDENYYSTDFVNLLRYLSYCANRTDLIWQIKVLIHFYNYINNKEYTSIIRIKIQVSIRVIKSESVIYKDIKSQRRIKMYIETIYEQKGIRRDQISYTNKQKASYSNKYVNQNKDKYEQLEFNIIFRYKQYIISKIVSFKDREVCIQKENEFNYNSINQINFIFNSVHLEDQQQVLILFIYILYLLSMQHFVTGIFQSFSMCGLRNRLVHMLAFRPPQATYELRLRESKKQKVNKKKRYYSFDDSGYFNQQNNSEQQLPLTNDQQCLNKKRKNVRNPEQYPEYDFIKIPNRKIHQKEEIIVRSDTCKVTSYFLNQNNNQQIASVHLDRNSDYVMLFSHGNACDLGTMIDKLIKLVNYTKTNVFAYEYSGYGQSEGKSNDISIIRNIQVAYNFLVHQLGYKPTQIIVYGYSIGSGPSITLSSNPQFPIGGLIIESGFSSGLRVISNKIEDTPYYDLFPNIDRIQLIRCPIFIMHGANDKIISTEHAKQLAHRSNNLYDLWIPENVGHCGIDTDIQYRKSYFQKLREFIDYVTFQNENIPDLISKNTAKSHQATIYKHYYQTKLV